MLGEHIKEILLGDPPEMFSQPLGSWLGSRSKLQLHVALAQKGPRSALGKEQPPLERTSSLSGSKGGSPSHQ